VVDGSGLIGSINPLPSTTSINHSDQPLRSTTSSLTVAGPSASSEWFIEVVDGSGLIDQSADCPEAEARHGQTGRGFQSDRGGLRLQDNRQAGLMNHPPR
jgi:hypothetical protein